MVLTEKHINTFFMLAVLALLLSEFGPGLADGYRRLRLARDVGQFHDALVKAREKALAVEFGPGRWAVYNGKEALRQGEWKDGERLASNMPGGRLRFDSTGVCRTADGDRCASEDPATPRAMAHAIAVASDARRIYTITFADNGRPLLWENDF